MGSLLTEEEAMMTRRFLIGLATLLGVAFGVTSVNAQQKSLKEELVGAWSFVSSTGKALDGSPVWGQNPKGLLIFMADGHYASMIMRSDRPKFASSNRLQGTPDENRSVVQGTIATFGKYTVDEQKKAFSVRFEGSTFPNNEGTEQTRPVTISGDELKIQNPASTIGGTTELIYRRAK
jgi:hypothetical protein